MAIELACFFIVAMAAVGFVFGYAVAEDRSSNWVKTSEKETHYWKSKYYNLRGWGPPLFKSTTMHK